MAHGGERSMARVDEWRYDVDGNCIIGKLTRSSTRYVLSDAERRSIATIADYLENGRYSSKETLEAHLNFVSSLISKLTSARKDESQLFQGSLTLESQLSHIFELSRRLVALKGA